MISEEAIFFYLKTERLTGNGCLELDSAKKFLESMHDTEICLCNRPVFLFGKVKGNMHLFCLNYAHRFTP